jgi:hypothetical protein
MDRALIKIGITISPVSVSMRIDIRFAEAMGNSDQGVEGMGQIDVPVTAVWKLSVHDKMDHPGCKPTRDVPVNRAVAGDVL